MQDGNVKSEVKLNFKDTLNLPKTDFPIRANAKIDDPKIIERWQKEDLFKKSFNHNQGKQKFILHDGPPYANGNIHLGHAYNKILKDIVTKAQRMQSNHVPVTPGWDCHGLPIELKVTQEKKDLSPTELKKACRQYATKWIEIQKEEFKKLGVLMDWDNPYLTMSSFYESYILRSFGIFVQKELVERKNKTVPWCPSDQTVLASAEIEYYDKKDPSIYVLFTLATDDVKNVFPELAEKVVSLLVWTTTPWTLPLNRAVLLRPNTTYQILDIANNLVIIAKDLSDKICSLMSVDKKVIKEFNSEELKNSKVLHPFIIDLIVPIILDQSVSLQDGTAAVHCAPGCGPEDYEVGIKNNLEIFSPISADGKYTQGIKPASLEGMSIKDALKWVIENLEIHKKLFYKTSINHSYPHCWRCRNPLIFRATKQWFIDLSKEDLRKKAVDAVDYIQMVPQTSANRLKAALEGRLEWCISRQRIWGVPIVAIICQDCDFVYVNKEFIDEIAEHFEKDGIEYWDKVSVENLLSNCPKCNGKNLKKETDILDVWFDSGISHYAVLKQNPELNFPADIYLEGKDQHRGWFQSSLLTSLIIEQQACTKAIVTHGFTVDELGKKMSKSIGNVVSPSDIIDRLGTDGLRLWTSSIDLKDEAVVSEALLRNVQEVFSKIRNTCRFLLSNLYDFDIDKDSLKVEDLLWIDKYALTNLYSLSNKIKQSYNDYRFTMIFHELAEYCAKDLSSFYLDIIKDRLYVEQADGKLRRSAQTVCWYILDNLTKLMAPILSFSAEIISDYYQKNKTESIHLQNFSDITNQWENLISQIRSMSFYKNYLKNNSVSLEFDSDKKLIYWSKQWNMLINVRNAILKAIEQKREQGLIKHPLEASITISLDINKKEIEELELFLNDIQLHGQTLESFFKDFLIVSQFNMLRTNVGLQQSEFKGLFINVDRAQGDKCPRCWQYTFTNDPHKLCDRCKKIVSHIQK